MGVCWGKSKKQLEEEKQDQQDTVTLKNSKLPIIWVLGGPGSGKSTQCTRLVKKYEFLHVSPGDLLSAEIASGSSKGEELNEIMTKGILVPRDMVRGLIKQAMVKNIATAKGFLIDGYPREVEQGIDFENKVGLCSLILYYECSDDTMMKRLLERGIQSRRVNDNEDIIKQRLKIFHKHTEHVMELYSTKVVTIDANADTDTIFAITVENIDKLLAAASTLVSSSEESLQIVASISK